MLALKPNPEEHLHLRLHRARSVDLTSQEYILQPSLARIRATAKSLRLA